MTSRADDWRNAQTDLTAALRRAADGDRAALKEVFDRSSVRLMGICVHILKDKDDAEDVMQEVFVSVWTRAGSFDPDRASPQTWLATIARNRAIDHLRARRSRTQATEDGHSMDMPDDRPDAFAAAVGREEGERIHYCLSTLDVRAQEMIRIAFFEGLSHSDLARRAGKPLGTVKSWIRRGLLRLKECLEG